MYKEMIPAEVIARKTALRSADDHSSERLMIHSPTPAEAGDVTDQNALKEWQERCLRLAAEFDNFKKRTARDNERRAAEQKAAFIHNLLPVVDNLERALSSSPVHPDGRLRQGVELTLRQLTQVLSQHGFISSNDLGRPFDPQFHEAVSVGYDPRYADNVILEVWQRGWLRGEGLFRPAKVVVNDLKRSSASANREKVREEKGDNHA